MKDRLKPAAAIAGFCLVWVLILFTTSAVVYSMAGDKALLAGQMLRFAPPEESGLPENEYPEMGKMIAGFLTGSEPVFQYIYTDGENNRVACFQPHEAEHMADCRGLILLAETIRRITGIAALILIGAGIMLRGRRKSFASGMLVGLFFAAVVFFAVLLWGIVSFDSLFTAFHRLAFTNDGWLLDARTDLLIRLMPTPFFISLGIRVLLTVLAAALVSLAAAAVIRRTENRSKGADAPRMNAERRAE